MTLANMAALAEREELTPDMLAALCDCLKDAPAEEVMALLAYWLNRVRDRRKRHDCQRLVCAETVSEEEIALTPLDYLALRRRVVAQRTFDRLREQLERGRWYLVLVEEHERPDHEPLLRCRRLTCEVQFRPLEMP